VTYLTTDRSKSEFRRHDGTVRCCAQCGYEKDLDHEQDHDTRDRREYNLKSTNGCHCGQGL
jgi:hypothetical protein